MSSPLITAKPEEMVQSVIEMMAARRISAIIIQEEGEKDAYMITSGDIIRYLAKHLEGVEGIVARDIMNGPITPVNIKDPISKALELMYLGGHKRVVVANDAGEYVGLITIRDVLGSNYNFSTANPFLLLAILKDSGAVVYQYQFPTLQDFSLMDADMLGASMVAIAMLLDELLEQSGDLKVVRKENFVFMLEEGTNIKVLLVADRESIELRKNLVEFVRIVEELNSNILDNMQPSAPPPVEVFQFDEAFEKVFAPFLEAPTLEASNINLGNS